VIRYSEALKLRLAEEVASGKYRSLDEAGRRISLKPQIRCFSALLETAAAERSG
jgi:hypothetical protein